MTVPPEPSKREEWRAHWSVVMPCFLGMMLITAHSHSLGVMIGPLEREFGWPRAQISAGGLIISAMALLAAPLIGAAVDRIGARRIALLGVPVYCAMLSTLSLASAGITSWWGLWILVALGSMGILPVVWLAAVNGFFRKSRGMAMAIAMSGSGLGAAVWPFLTNTMVDALGWRLAYVALAVISAVVTYPFVYLFLRDPVNEVDSNSAPVADSELPTARREWMTPRFFRLVAASFIFAMAGYALSNNLVPVLIGEGLAPGTAAATVGLLGLGVIVGRLLGGYLLDIMNGNIVAGACVLLQIVPAVILLSTAGSQAWAAFSCLLIGLSVGTELDASAYLAARHFGARNFGSVFGVINGTLMFSAGVAPMAANYVYDVTRSYDYVLIALIPLLIVSAILFLTLGDYRQFDEETGRPLPLSA